MTVQQRIRIIDVQPRESTVAVTRNRNNKRHGHQRYEQKRENTEPSLSDQQWPLDSMLIKREILAYGRRMTLNGYYQGTSTTLDLVSRIKALGIQHEELSGLLLDVEARVQKERAKRVADNNHASNVDESEDNVMINDDNTETT
jgi:hypothetical protein